MKRTQRATSLLITAVASFFAVQGCNTTTSLQPVPQQDDGSGGDTSVVGTTGGATGVNTGVSTGGTSSGVGGTTTQASTGGTTMSGGDTGGTASGVTTGGRVATGGRAPTGGRSTAGATGGSVGLATGGDGVVAATGGTPVVGATGGTPAVGATGGAAAIGNTGKVVTFTTGKANGAMSGWAFVALGSADTITDPTCGTAKAAITAAAPCTTSANWSSATGLCVTGAIPALPATPTATDYSSNWGLSVGVNSTETAGGGLGQSLTSMAITVTGSPLTGLRAVVHRKGDADSVSYCAALTSGTAIALTSFVTDCYNTTPTGTKITSADIPNIDKVSVQVSSGGTAITVANLCITGITFS